MQILRLKYQTSTFSINFKFVIPFMARTTSEFSSSENVSQWNAQHPYFPPSSSLSLCNREDLCPIPRNQYNPTADCDDTISS